MLLLMCLTIVAVNIVSTESTQNTYKGRYTRDIKEYQVVVPKKVSEDGQFVSYYLPHFYSVERVKRGVDTGKVHYILPVNGEDRVLELLPTEDFNAPGVVIEHHESDARNNVNTVKLRRPQKRKCYYHGRVRDEPTSSAAITTCSGLAGSIKIGTTQYLIEPVEDDGKPTADVQHRHLLYKRSHQRQISNHTSCGTIGSFETAFKNRMEWEEKFGRKVEESMKGMENPFSLNEIDKFTLEKPAPRQKRWCTTCRPNNLLKCQTPHPPCEVDRPLFIELLVVVGPRVAITKFLEDDTEQYVNTIINIAVKHFQDSSLARPIRVKLVRMITMGYIYPELDPRRYEPQTLLQHFCEWQMHFNPRSEEHPNHHDFAIYLVKFEPCQGSLLGLTNLASMCRPDKACAVISEEGLLSGHIITHMIGHSLGADHDDLTLSGCCPEEPDGTCYHMGPNICTWASAFSVCSRQCILKFVNTHAGWCMTDIPTAVDLTDPILLPGQVYTAAEQCRINFEIDTYACLVGEFCKRLYCKINDEECASTGDPPAQGTRCGPDQWCFNGRCVHRGSRPGATNGEWGIWSHWTPCTKTCGGGIQSAHRACDSPAPSQGGRLCPGSWIKSRMCNVGPCADAGKGFLDQQCKNTNARPYHGRKHEWLFFNQQIEDLQCVVVCINERSEVAVRNPLAIDGTFCKPGTKDVCVRGSCKSVGCDWVIGSQAKEDACGICHGNGTECKIMQGFFGDTNFEGVIQFLKLPIGTSMILVRETRPSTCFFVITNSVNSSYYLNNDNEDRQFFTGVFKIQSTSGIYQLKADMERIFIKDPLVVPITISSVCHDRESSIGILYQYALPEPHNPTVTPTYTWEFLSWDKCPHPCGGAIQRSVAVCVEAQGGEVEDCYCSPQSKPPDKIRVCNQHPCQAKWWVGPWAQCECYHKEGITTRMVMCAHLKEARSSYISIVDEEECIGDVKPLAEKPCDPQKNKEMWFKKGYTKRDLADIIPYSEDAELYTVWGDMPEEKIPFVVNVREIVHSLDPEDVKDYAYMKRTGMTNLLWEGNGEYQDSGVRVRRRRRKIIPTTQTVTKTEMKDKSHDVKHKKHNKTSKPVKDTDTVIGKKKSTEAENKSSAQAEPKMKKLVEEDSAQTAKQLGAEKSVVVTTQLSVTTHRVAKAGHAVKQVTHTIDLHVTKPSNSEVAKPKEAATQAYSAAVIPVTVQSRREHSRETEVEPTRQTSKQHSAAASPTTEQAKKSHVKEIERETVKQATKQRVTAAAIAVTLPPRKPHNKNEAEMTAPRVFVQGTAKAHTQTALTVPEVLSDPGVTAYSVFASETPEPQKKCWQIEMKQNKQKPTCRPAEEAVPEPAEAAPEMDFMNTSNIKIYIVPIQTTVRTIIQNDQEFVMMETLAKYPVADELNVVEHWGDAARRELKLAKDRQQANTQKSLVQD